MNKILQNQIKCTECGDEPYSRSRYDFRYCNCGAVSVDGGMNYLKRTGSADHIDEMSIEIDMHSLAALLDIMRDHTLNDLGQLCAMARYFRDNGNPFENK